MRALIIPALCVAITGCAKGSFENRLTTTLTGDRAFVSSLYGPFGITAELSADDAREIQRLREQSLAYEQIVRAVTAAQQPTKGTKQ